MPELPEVETVRRGLAPALEGRRIAHAEARRPNLRYMLPERFAERLTGRRVERLDRRAKYILAYLEGEEVLLIHLGMSGRFTIHAKAAGKAGKPGNFHHGAPEDGAGTGAHDHIVFDMEDGTRIVYSDHRRFGFMDLIPAASLDANPHLASLGPEPLGNGFSAAILGERLKDRRTPIKAALLDQRTVAGLGNIYVCEALFRSGISPNREARSIGPERRDRLARAIRDVLTEAIAAGGSTLRDYAHTDGELGYFQHSFSVYDRLGAPCSKPGCGGTVKRMVQSGRSTFYCSSCQR
ncbi:MAG: bifunctional DNA-formamidopyrimidine glycosylase/DNA-(apurinic or apyrimidinic site) lyase [Parvibaculum sp.]|uniref:bifunctional DNA-formamidopyrimidine glycosylase/DNA-(apurinic or apyrimidinic site) lyase n=1 Tax=Parvibaculum sp. TaxID=2024848 RepID=UPI00284664D8|nr:bifunctional DNA-formamidopyrimidine glycosylase/DNA-(apurinic or apyrimidinic site) lyase [Parvibaculum sp.]MDR3500768.1 bifunctional DNA-formamidopyrimidine glycosylase/DNA-(apurinic or apyrimidinic site) lyase [Parvibaculum sp.]